MNRQDACSTAFLWSGGPQGLETSALHFFKIKRWKPKGFRYKKTCSLIRCHFFSSALEQASEDMKTQKILTFGAVDITIILNRFLEIYIRRELESRLF